jgi:RHS repeat-associated protein
LAGSTDYNVFGAARSTSGSSSVFGFTGQQTDATSLVFLRARYLDTGLGRFLSPDTVFPNASGTQGYNLYGYVANNPTTAVDPTGHAAAFEVSIRVIILQAVAAFARAGLSWVARNQMKILIALLVADTVVAGPAVVEKVREIIDEKTKPKPIDKPNPGPSPKPIPLCIPGVTFPCKSGGESVVVERLLDGNNSRQPSAPDTGTGQFRFNPAMSTFELALLGGNPAAPNMPYMLELTIVVPTSPAQTPGNSGPVTGLPECSGRYEPPPAGHWGISCVSPSPPKSVQAYARANPNQVKRNPLYTGTFAPGAR